MMIDFAWLLDAALNGVAMLSALCMALSAAVGLVRH